VLDRIKHLVSVVRTAEVVKGLPSLTRTVVPLDLPPEAMQLYRQAESGLLGRDQIHADAVLVKLQQIANGRVLNADGGLTIVHNTKMEAAADIINALVDAGEQVIVVYQFNADAAVILARWPRTARLFRSETADECVKEWNNGLPILLLHPRSAGHGTNLQHAPRGGHMLWLSATWSSELYEQTVGRVHRPGAHRPTRVTLLAANDTLDFAVLSVLWRKVNAQLLVKLYLLERRLSTAGMPSNFVLSDRLRQARAELSRHHPDHGGTAEAFRAAWSRYEALKDQLE
jgi:SNF2 family DNA or RNA helicase